MNKKQLQKAKLSQEIQASFNVAAPGKEMAD